MGLMLILQGPHLSYTGHKVDGSALENKVCYLGPVVIYFVCAVYLVVYLNNAYGENIHDLL